ncbi:hypothetical protein ACFWFI_08115 [Streptomyces sp. NPDC060209]|uniref:hypothetical protein n=1 Tax=Streptomyces sp. NPDC060209 TaxID=3347073 RepID=UPI003663DCDC
MAKAREEPAPPENGAPRDARNALEHLDEAVLGEYAATPPKVGKKDQRERALRQLPEQMMSLETSGPKLFGVLEPM